MQLGKEYYDDYFHSAVEEPKLTFKDSDSFWVDVIGMDEDTGEPKVHGKIRMQIDIYPKDQAENNKVGAARQEPNHSPFLPPPVGRLSLSLNPFKMLVSFFSSLEPTGWTCLQKEALLRLLRHYLLRLVHCSSANDSRKPYYQDDRKNHALLN